MSPAEFSYCQMFNFNQTTTTSFAADFFSAPGGPHNVVKLTAKLVTPEKNNPGAMIFAWDPGKYIQNME